MTLGGGQETGGPGGAKDFAQGITAFPLGTAEASGELVSKAGSRSGEGCGTEESHKGALISVTPIKLFPMAEHCFKHFTCSEVFHPHTDTMG